VTFSTQRSYTINIMATFYIVLQIILEKKLQLLHSEVLGNGYYVCKNYLFSNLYLAFECIALDSTSTLFFNVYNCVHLICCLVYRVLNKQASK